MYTIYTSLITRRCPEKKIVIFQIIFYVTRYRGNVFLSVKRSK